MIQNNNFWNILEGKRNELSMILADILEGPVFKESDGKGTVFALPMKSLEEMMNIVFRIVYNSAVKGPLPIDNISYEKKSIYPSGQLIQEIRTMGTGNALFLLKLRNL